MVIGFSAGGSGYALNILPDVVIPVWVWVGLAILGVFVAQFLAYRDLRNRLIKQVITPNQIEEVLTRLARLREKGGALRFTGLELKDINEVPRWKGQVMTWRKQVEPEIVKLSPSEATIFRTGGIVDIELFKKKALNDEHAVFLEVITQDIENIRKLVERLSPENLTKRYSIEK